MTRVQGLSAWSLRVCMVQAVSTLKRFHSHGFRPVPSRPFVAKDDKQIARSTSNPLTSYTFNPHTCFRGLQKASAVSERVGTEVSTLGLTESDGPLQYNGG